MKRLMTIIILFLFIISMYVAESVVLNKSINELDNTEYDIPDNYIAGDTEIEDYINNTEAGDDAISIINFLTFTPPQLGNPLLGWIMTPTVIVIGIVIVWLILQEIHDWIPFLPSRKG